MTRVSLLLVAASLGALFAACDLNPQPLPPGDDDEKNGTPTTVPGAGGGASSGGFESPSVPADSADAGSATDSGHDDASTDGGADGDAGAH